MVVAMDLVVLGENAFIVKTSLGIVSLDGLLLDSCVVGSYTEK